MLSNCVCSFHTFIKKNLFCDIENFSYTLSIIQNLPNRFLGFSHPDKFQKLRIYLKISLRISLENLPKTFLQTSFLQNFFQGLLKKIPQGLFLEHFMRLKESLSKDSLEKSSMLSCQNCSMVSLKNNSRSSASISFSTSAHWA